MNATEAINRAKAFWPMRDGDAHVSRDTVRLRELCHALEQVLGNLPKPARNSVDTEAYLMVLRALQDGELTAIAFGTDTVIPPDSWSAVKVENAFEAWESGYWYNEILRDEDCLGFRGQLPVVSRDQAEAWIKQRQPAKQRPMSEADAVRQFRAWVKEFEEPDKPNKEERRAWGAQRGLSRERVRELSKYHAPEYWKKSGRQKGG